MNKTAFFYGLWLSTFLLQAQSEQALRTKHYNVEKSVAIQGYDPVSYFMGKPKVGKKDITVNHKGIEYRFFTLENANEFKQNPEKYEPAYGGWCAYAMGATGEKVEIDPTTFKIIEGKLYLFYNKFFTNTLPDWNKKEAELKKKADENWLKVYK